MKAGPGLHLHLFRRNPRQTGNATSAKEFSSNLILVTAVRTTTKALLNLSKREVYIAASEEQNNLFTK